MATVCSSKFHVTCASAASAWGSQKVMSMAVQRDSGGQFSTGLLPPVDLGIQRAEAAVAVGHERAHAEFVGQGC